MGLVIVAISLPFEGCALDRLAGWLCTMWMLLIAALGMGLIWLVLGLVHASQVLDEGARLVGQDTATDRPLLEVGARSSARVSQDLAPLA